ncbi:MAG: Omp28-related outer membrane protein [Sphingobacteriales bacterium]|nr:MAG: Omp28-related outer membrane protein [Sphingobacteriales bacterium]
MKSRLFLLSALISTSASYAQLSVSTEGKKFVIVEEGTGAWCGHCPDGAVRLDAILKANPNAIGTAIHDADPMEIPDGATINTAYATGFPYGTVDRADFSGKVGQNRGSWSTLAGQRLKMTADFDVKMTHKWDKSKNEITVTVSAKALKDVTGKYNLNVFITEDNVSGGATYDQSCFSDYNDDATHPMYKKATTTKNGTPYIQGYQHMHVLRTMLGGAWGTKGVIKDAAKKGDSASKTFTFVIPTTWKAKDLKLIGVVQEENSDPLKRSFNNAVQAKFYNWSTDVTDVAAVSSMTIYPNPATNMINVSASLATAGKTSVSIMNAIGQVVYQRDVTTNGLTYAQNISLDNFSKGVYILTINNDGVKSAQRFIVK